MFFAIVTHFRGNRHFHHGEIREDCFRRVRVNKRNRRLRVCSVFVRAVDGGISFYTGPRKLRGTRGTGKERKKYNNKPSRAGTAAVSGGVGTC